jgi:hypothetical protein
MRHMHKVSRCTLMHKQRSACTCKQHYMHTGRRGQKMHRAVAAGINAPLCAPNIQLIVQILTGCIINSDLHFAGAGSRSHAATRKGAALCSSSATAPLVSLLSMHCCNLLSFFAQRRVFRCSGAGGLRQYNQNTSLSQHWVYIARRGNKLFCSLGWLMAGRLPACWHALAKV